MWLVLQWSSKEDTRFVFIKRFTFKLSFCSVYVEVSVQREAPRVQLHIVNITRMFTSRKWSLGESNVFTGVCLFTEGYLWSHVLSVGQVPGHFWGVGMSGGDEYIPGTWVSPEGWICPVEWVPTTHCSHLVAATTCTVSKRVVCILLECILVYVNVHWMIPSFPVRYFLHWYGTA